MNNEKITKREENFADWYTDVVTAAHLIDYSSVKGFTILEPNGYALWEKMQSVLDKMFKETNHHNVSMPLLIPEGLLKKEGELVEGFAPECAWVTHGGRNKLDEKLAVRPTSETLFSDYFSKKVKTYRDLPLQLNQWCSVVRWEKETRPFLRGREFLWQEGHTVHSSQAEAEAETNRMIDIYRKFFEEYLATPVITGRKTDKEKFAGAEYSLTIEALTQNGVCLQSGTSHYFGQKFAKAYDIKFINKDNAYEYCYQTSWGVSTRMIGALIMAHSDDAGLVLPPKIAPKQVALVPIKKDDRLISMCEHIKTSLDEKDVTSYIDYSDKTAGFKFAETEVNGIPLRVEVGPRDLDNNEVTVVRRDTREKMVVKLNDVINVVTQQLEKMQSDMYERALKNVKEKTYDAASLDEVKEIMENHPGFVNAYWCGDEACELKMKEIRGTKSRCITETYETSEHKCVVCGKEAKHKVIWGIQY